MVFNSADLNLGNASIHSDALQTQQVDSSRSYDSEQERTTLHFATPLPANSKATLKIAFDGALTGNMMGYYRSSYEADGKKKYYSLTQFEVCSVHICGSEKLTSIFALAHRRPPRIPVLG